MRLRQKGSLYLGEVPGGSAVVLLTEPGAQRFSRPTMGVQLRLRDAPVAASVTIAMGAIGGMDCSP